MNANVLSTAEIEFYWAHGYVCIADAISAGQLAALRIDFAAWVDESRHHSKSYGETLANRPRFDLEVGHSADHPALRRVASPIEVSDAYLKVMRDNRGLDAAAQLIGPNFSEATLFGIAHAYEHSSGWHKLRPNLS